MTSSSLVSIDKLQTDRRAYLLLCSATSIFDRLQNDLPRKTLHALIAFVPLLVKTFGLSPVLILLAAGIFIYSCSEYMRLSGRLTYISRITLLAMRSHEGRGFISGPLTLCGGTICSLLIFPLPIAEIAIYALAFGDGIASIVGKLYGTIRIPGSGAKTWEGSMTCMLMVFYICYLATHRPLLALAVALVAMIAELYSGKDLDNIFMPLGVGASAYLLLFVGL